MVSTEGKSILDSANRSIESIRQSPVNLLNSLKKFLKYVMMGRTGLSIFLIVWLVVFSILFARPSESKEEDETRQKYFYLHRVWFGEESIIMILFKMWYYTLILLMLNPILRELVIFLKLRLML